MSQNRANLREARQKNAMFGTFWANFLQNTAIFPNIWLQIFKIPVLWKKLKGSGEKLKYFEKKLKLFAFKTQWTGSDQFHPLKRVKTR